MNRVQAELEENEKSMAELTEQLKKLEDEAGEIMKACQEAEVGTLAALYDWDLLFLFSFHIKYIQAIYFKPDFLAKLMARFMHFFEILK